MYEIGKDEIYENVLLIDSDKLFGKMLTSFLKYFGYKVYQIYSREELLSMGSDKNIYDVVLVGESETIKLLEIYNILQKDPKLAKLPKIILYKSDKKPGLHFFREDVKYTFVKPLKLDKFVSALKKCTSFIRIMLVAPKDEKYLKAMDTLKLQGYEVEIYTSDIEALEKLGSKRFKIIFIDVAAITMKLPVFVAWIRSYLPYKSIPIVVIETEPVEEEVKQKLANFRVEVYLSCCEELIESMITICEEKVFGADINVFADVSNKKSILSELKEIEDMDKMIDVEVLPFDLDKEMSQIKSEGMLEIKKLDEELSSLDKELADLGLE